jgi:phosphopantetheinyl transferase
MLSQDAILWKVEKISDIILNVGLLSPSEKDQYDSFKIAKRKNEFLASRILAKKFISDSISCNFSDVEIKNDKDRKPYAVVNKKLLFYISLSHREEYVGVAFRGDMMPYIGIDIELFEKKNKEYLTDFMSSSELDNNDEEIIRIWAMKEAFLKMVGRGLSVSARDIEINNDDILYKGEAKLLLSLFKICKINYEVINKDNYLVALCYNGG